MPIQYVGPRVNEVFEGETQQQIIDGISANLQIASWDIVSGGGADVTLESAPTADSGLVTRVRLFTGSTCMKIEFRNQQENRGSIDHPLLPGVDFVFRIIANPHQLFVMRPNVYAAPSRHFIAGGTPYLEPHMRPFISECIWSQANGSGQNETDTRVAGTFRTQTYCSAFGGFFDDHYVLWHNINGAANSNQAWHGYWSTTRWNQALVVQDGATNTNIGGTATGLLWHNGEAFKHPARIAWGLTGEYGSGGLPGQSPRCNGQLFDAVVITDAYPGDLGADPLVPVIFDSHRWYNITNLTTTPAGPSLGCLFVAIGDA